MGGQSSSISVPDQIDVLSHFRENDDYFHSFFAERSSKPKDQTFYLIPKTYNERIIQEFNYNENYDDLGQLNIYKSNEAQKELKENAFVFKLILDEIKKRCEKILKDKVKLPGIVNMSIVTTSTKKDEEIKNDFGIRKNYILKEKYTPILPTLWNKLNDLYGYDSEIKRQGFIVKGEIIILVEYCRVDGIFIFNGRYKHFAFSLETNKDTIKLIDYLKENGVKSFLNEINYKYDQPSNSIFIKMKVPSIKLGGLEVNIIYLDDYMYEKMETTIGENSEITYVGNQFLITPDYVPTPDNSEPDNNMINKKIIDSLQRDSNTFLLFKNGIESQGNRRQSNLIPQMKFSINENDPFGRNNIQSYNPPFNRHNSMKINDTDKNNSIVSSKDSGIFSSLSQDTIKFTKIELNTFPSLLCSILRCLINIKKFKDYFISEENEENNCPLSFEIKNIITSMGLQNDIISTKMNKIIDYFKSNEIKNSYPLSVIEQLLDFLDKESKNNEISVNIDNNDKYNDIKLSNDKDSAFLAFEKRKEKEKSSELINLFSGIEKKLFYCSKCNTKFYQFSYFKIFTLKLDSINSNLSINYNIKNSMAQRRFFKNDKNKANCVSLRNCLINTLKFRLGTEQRSCQNCGGYTLTSKNIYERSPEIFIIKIDNIGKENIDLVAYLDLAEFIEKKQDNVSYAYKLSSFIEYNPDKDDYITYLSVREYNENEKLFEDKWFKYSKNSKKMLDISQKEIIFCPDLLIYEKNQ